MIDFNNVAALSLEGEKWAQIPNCPNYLVSNMGRVYSGNKKRVKDGSYTESGYHIVELRSEYLPNGRKKFRISRLVAEAFCKGYSDDIEVHHCNFNKLDDTALNLMCVTHDQHVAIHNALKRYNKYLLFLIAAAESEVAA